jgi:hypothetical protein
MKYRKPGNPIQNINLYNLAMSYNMADLTFIPYYDTEENDRLKKLFRGDEEIKKNFILERNLIEKSKFDESYFANFFDFDFSYFFVYARLQRSKITVHDVTKDLDF